MQPRLRTTVLGDSDSQQSQLKKEPGNSAIPVVVTGTHSSLREFRLVKSEKIRESK